MFSLTLPEPPAADGRPDDQQPRALPLGNGHGVRERLVSVPDRDVRPCTEEQLATQTVQLGFVESFAGPLHDVQRFVDRLQPRLVGPGAQPRFREHPEELADELVRPGGERVGHALMNLLQAFFAATLLDARPPCEDRCPGHQEAELLFARDPLGGTRMLARRRRVPPRMVDSRREDVRDRQ